MSEATELTDEQREAELEKASTVSGTPKGRTPRTPTPPPTPDPEPAAETHTTPDGVVLPLYDPPATDNDGRLLRGAAHRVSATRVIVEP